LCIAGMAATTYDLLNIPGKETMHSELGSLFDPLRHMLEV